MRHLTLVCAFLLLACVCISQACNTALCASIVTKCMLLKVCSDDFHKTKNVTQMKNCQLCLSNQYTECCSCVELCPNPDPEDELMGTSSVEDLNDPIPELFKVLTEEPDVEMRWTTLSYHVHYDALIFKPGYGIHDLTPGSRERERLDDILESRDNCTVAFMSHCLSLSKCRAACKSMGAARYRWFHDHGCCQCIGSSCISYGHNSPQCANCPPLEDEEETNEVERKVKDVKEFNSVKDKDKKDDKNDDEGDDVKENEAQLDNVEG